MRRLKDALMLTDKGYSDLIKAIIACTLTNLAMMLPFMVTIQIFQQLLEPLTGGEISFARLWLMLPLGIAAAALVFLASRNDYRKTYVASYMESEKTRVAVAEKIRRLPMRFFGSRDLAELTTNIMGDCATAEHVLSHLIPQLIANGISIALICAMLALFDWRMALAVLVSVPVSFLVILVSRKLQNRLSEKQVTSKLEAASQVQEYLEGIKVIKSCGLEGAKFKSLDEALKKMMKLAIRMEFGTGVFVAGAQMLLQAGVGLTVFVGTSLLAGGKIELVPLFMFFLIAVRIYGPIMVELTLLPELFYHRVATRRMRQLMEAPVMTGRETPLSAFDIRFEDVSFSYHGPGGEKAVRNLTIEMPAGAITALVGPSGCGKSTVTRLIARFWDVDAGSVKIGGVDVKTLEPEHLMRAISFVFQDVVLFRDTVLNNIRLGDMGATEQQVIEAAKAANCDEFIRNLPDGYQTMLGENGATLSGGERQRLSIARALLKNAPIVLLDEATASLDPENEAQIQEAVSRLIRGKTVVIIAHRLRTIAGADRIVVLEGGRLLEQGTHAELLREKGLYERMAGIQRHSMGWSV